MPKNKYDNQLHASTKFFAGVGAKAGMQIALHDYVQHVTFAYRALQRARNLRMSGKTDPSYHLQMRRARFQIEQASENIKTFREWASGYTPGSTARGMAVVNNRGRV